MSEVARHQSDSGFYYASGTRNGGGGNAHAHAIADANFTENQSQTTTEIHDQTPDALLAYELNQLSFQERNTINEEVHGVHNSYPEETPKLLHDSLIQLEQEIQKIKHKPAYELAQEKYGISNSNTNTNTTLNPNPTGKHGGGTYVNTDTFRLIFLRCEIFNTKKAAVRIIAFLELSYEFCGEFSLYRTILLSDFDSKGLKLLKTGVVQILPGRDRSGRRVMGNFSGDFNPKQHELHDRVSLLTTVLFVLRFRFCTFVRTRKQPRKTDGDIHGVSQSVRMDGCPKELDMPDNREKPKLKIETVSFSFISVLYKLTHHIIIPYFPL